MLDRHTRFGSRNCTLLQIDTSALNGSFSFRAEEIVHELSLSIPEATQASVAKEYLIAHYTPPHAIIRSQTADEIHAGKIKPFSVGFDVAWEPTVLCFTLDLEVKKILRYSGHSSVSTSCFDSWPPEAIA